MDQTTSQVKLSIVVPCYNTASYLKRCIDSLLVQTLTDIEIIPVNDGSKDNTLEILESYEQQYPELIHVVDKPNGGLWAARWSGTDVAKGEYVTYLDSDDYVDPTFAEDFYTTAKAEDADVIICGFKRTDEKTGAVLSTELAEKLPAFKVADDAGRLIAINPAAWNKCFSRDLLLRIKRLAEPPLILEDIMLAQLAYLNAERAIAFTGTATYNYMFHEGSMINTVTVPQVESFKTSLLEVKGQFNSKGAALALQQALDATAFLHLGIAMTYRLSCSPDVDLKHELTKNVTYLDEHFSTWRHNPYINIGYALSHAKSYKLLYAGFVAYKTGLLLTGLKFYNWYLKTFHTELKW